MSEIITNKLTGKTAAGNVTITSEGGSATMQLQQGVAKAWMNLDGTGTIAVQDSFNTTSATDNGTGDYRQTFASAMGNANYSMVSAGGRQVDAEVRHIGCGEDTTAKCDISAYDGGSRADVNMTCTAFFGDLA